ncbi:TetR/AcrR family transcriptional regulator [Treponema sp.]|uniref:TetR/AcrR family transcriptional regulator n=1 Tax=Treponema sp. TaxID=166 RepID=UPI003F1108FF
MSEKITRENVIKSLLDTSFYKSAGGTSLSDIADSLGIKKASLYNHFESRSDIIEQTTNSCSEYLKSLSFIPSEIESVAKKYPVETVLKGIVSRYVKMHEKPPLFQIYTFIESQKYFDLRAAKIVREQNEKLESQTEIVLETILRLGKIKIAVEQIPGIAKWFCSGINDLLNRRLLDRKQAVMQNPKSGEGELFTLQADDRGIEEINGLVEQFTRLLCI